MLTVEIQKKLGEFRLEVRLEAGQETLALLGASGSGKTVALKCIAGLLRPDEGRITLDGRTLYDSKSGICLPPQRRRVGYLFQHYALFPHMTVRQNIAAAVPERKRGRRAAEESLRRFRLEDAAEKRPGQLSGGQQQRAALARILAAEPEVVLLDEPFSALDSCLKGQLEAELAELLEGFSGSVLWVSHDRGEVFRNCGRVCVLDRGRSQGTVTVEELFRAPKTEAAARLSGCENFADAVSEGETVLLPAWGLRLAGVAQAPRKPCRVGIRACQVRPAEAGTAGAFPCTVARVIRDVSSVSVLLCPEGSAPGAPPLRMELSREAWERTVDRRRVWAAVRPEEVLFFRPPEELEAE